MTATGSLKAHGVLAVWNGNEAALTLANPAVETDGRIAATRGENWTARDGVSQTDVRDSAGFVPIESIDVSEGEVVWLAGPSYVDSYLKLLASGFTDRLEIGRWRSLPGNWMIRFGSALRFYETGANVASDARRAYEEALASGESPESEFVAAARAVDAGSPGVSRGDRRLADAVWYAMTDDFDLYSRAVRMASAALGRPDGEIKEWVEEQVEFYRARATPRAHPESTDEVSSLRLVVRTMSEAIERLLEKQRKDKETIARLRVVLSEAFAPGQTIGRKVEFHTHRKAPHRGTKSGPLKVINEGSSNKLGVKTVNPKKPFGLSGEKVVLHGRTKE